MQQRLRAAKEYNELRNLKHRSYYLAKVIANLAKSVDQASIQKVIEQIEADRPEIRTSNNFDPGAQYQEDGPQQVNINSIVDAKSLFNFLLEYLE